MAVTFSEQVQWCNSIYKYDDSAGTTTMVATPFSSFDYFTNDFEAGDIIYFGLGRYDVWEGINFPVATGIVADAYEVIWEYSKAAGAWGALTIGDDTEAFSKVGTFRAGWDTPTDIAMITPPTGSGTTEFFVRCRIVSVTNPTEGGANSGFLYYSAAKMVITGTETLLSMVAADKATTRTLMNTRNCTTSMIPSLCIQSPSGHARKITFTLAGTSAAEGDTLDITGTDSEENAQIESIDVSAGDGDYTTTKDFQNISSVDCTGWADGTLTMTQTGYGAIDRHSDRYQYRRSEAVAGSKNINIYSILGYVVIGNGSTATSVTIKDTHINHFCPYGDYYSAVAADGAGFYTLSVLNNATLTLGANSGGWGIDGCTVYGTGAGGFGNWTIANGGTLNLYGSALNYYNQSRIRWNPGSIGEMLDVLQMNAGGGFFASTGITLKRVILSENISYQFAAMMTEEQMEDVFVTGTSSYWRSIHTGDSTCWGIKAPVIGNWAQGGYVITLYANNCTADTWVNGSGTAQHYMYRNYHYDPTIIDKDGNLLSDVEIRIWNKDGTEVTNSPFTTDATGKCTTKPLITSIYYSGIPPVTDAYDYNPFKIQISKVGYETLVMKVADIYEKRENFSLKLRKSPVIGRDGMSDELR